MARKKHAMIQALRLAGLLAVAVIGTSPVLAAEPPRPNIVYVVADDLGWKDVGFHGSEIETPSLDRLAADGVTFDQFYVQPMCTPTRAALMTGRYPLRYGLQSFVILPEQTYGLPLDERLLPEALKEAGYDTAIVGKWHLGHADMAYWPKQRGFDYQYGPMIGEIDYFTHLIHGVNDWFVNNQPLYEEGYSTTLIGDAAVRTRATIRCSSTLPSTRRTRPTRRRRSISTAIPTSPIRTARPMTRW